MPLGATGCKSSDKPSTGSGADCPPGSTTPCPATVTVKIVLSAAVACPCHPLEINAIGTPTGGTFQWTVSGGGAQLVDAAGTATTTGATVFLRSFQPDNVNGKIPAQKATVQVTYTHPNGTATDSKDVPIHAIDFVVTNTAVNAGVTRANEAAGGVTLGADPATGVDTMSTTPNVEIQLDASCPRKTACASNHRVGWLQTVLTDNRRVRYTHSELVVTVPLPIRDGDAVSPTPFYDVATRFTGDRDKQDAHHFDSPQQGAPWVDPRPAAPAPPPAVNGQLRSINFSTGFAAWLVVQDIEWSTHDLDNSFVFLKHLDWSMSLNVTVNTTQAVGSRCTPVSNAPTLGSLVTGKGPTSPVLTAPFAGSAATVAINPAPPLP